MDAICSPIKSLWEQTSAGLVPVIIASWISNAAMRGVASLLRTRLQVPQHQTLISDYVERLQVLGLSFRPSSDIAPRHTPLTSGHGLRTAWAALYDFKFDWQHDERLMSGGLFENPTSHITLQRDLLDGPRQSEAEHITMDLMLSYMKQLLCMKDERSRSFALQINALLVDVLDDLDSDEDSASTNLIFGMTLIFGMQLLVENFKSFLLSEGAIQGINCRTLALKYALEVSETLDAIVASEDSTGLKCSSRGGLKLFESILFLNYQLKDYVSQKRFDFYYQTP